MRLLHTGNAVKGSGFDNKTARRATQIPIVGRYISRDPIGYKDGLNPYLYVHNNPINRIDPLGLWDAGGHFYTTLLIAKLSGYDHKAAMKLAYYSQMPDTHDHMSATGKGYMNGAKAIAGNEYYRDVQKGGHALAGYNADQLQSARENMKYAVTGRAMLDPYGNKTGGAATFDGAKRREDSLQSLGLMIHTYGDTYAHSQTGADGRDVGYPTGIGHGVDSFLGNNPDFITSNGKTLGRYVEYSNGLLAALGAGRTMGVDPEGSKVLKEFQDFLKGSKFKDAAAENKGIESWLVDHKYMTRGEYDPQDNIGDKGAPKGVKKAPDPTETRIIDKELQKKMEKNR